MFIYSAVHRVSKPIKRMALVAARGEATGRTLVIEHGQMTSLHFEVGTLAVKGGLSEILVWLTVGIC